jgi:predicted Fe-Mo cluster-binding NifX family protein
MIVAFPVMEDHGLASPVHNHFGSARYFMFVDTADNTFSVHTNRDQKHRHGQCQPQLALGINNVNAVVVGGIGRGALGKLTTGGIKAFRAVEGTVQENLDLIKQGHLPEFDPNQTCTHHAAADGCNH